MPRAYLDSSSILYSSLPAAAATLMPRQRRGVWQSGLFIQVLSLGCCCCCCCFVLPIPVAFSKFAIITYHWRLAQGFVCAHHKKRCHADWHLCSWLFGLGAPWTGRGLGLGHIFCCPIYTYAGQDTLLTHTHARSHTHTLTLTNTSLTFANVLNHKFALVNPHCRCVI